MFIFLLLCCYQADKVYKNKQYFRKQFNKNAIKHHQSKLKRSTAHQSLLDNHESSILTIQYICSYHDGASGNWMAMLSLLRRILFCSLSMLSIIWCLRLYSTRVLSCILTHIYVFFIYFLF